MRIYQRVGANTAISYGVGGLLLVALLFVGMLVAMGQMFLQTPAVLALFAGGFAVMFASYAVFTHRRHGVWPWQPLPLGSDDTEDELERDPVEN